MKYVISILVDGNRVDERKVEADSLDNAYTQIREEYGNPDPALLHLYGRTEEYEKEANESKDIYRVAGDSRNL